MTGRFQARPEMALVSQFKGDDLLPLKKKMKTNGSSGGDRGGRDAGTGGAEEPAPPGSKDVGEDVEEIGGDRAATNKDASPPDVKAEVAAAGGGESKPKQEDQAPSTSQRQLQGAYAEREAWLTKQELEGDIRFECISYNDRKDECNLEHLEWLLALKNIFARQLPNMPKEYIVRLVFDKHHRSMVALKKNKPFGGCTFRCFENQEFGEIVFLAISAHEQVRGYGTRLMNHLKDYAKNKENLTHFLTYADNNAIGYFQKQGFTREIFLEREKWGGFIKDYDGGTLMECALNFQLSYSQFSKIITQQRNFLDDQVKKVSRSHVVYPGLEHFKRLKQGEYKRVEIATIPGVKEAGQSKREAAAAGAALDGTPSGPGSGGEGQKKSPQFKLVTPGGLIAPGVASLHSFMTRVHAAVVDHNDSWPFKEPVDPSEVPDYYEVIKDPVDLSLVARRICSYEYYIKLEIFVADFKAMFTNARTYNSPDTIYYKCANRLESFFDDQIRSGISLT